MTTVFVDTAVVMYAAGRPHDLRAPARRVLEAVARGRLAGVTSVEVVQEILHRFSARGEPRVGAAMARDTLDLFAPVLPVTENVMRRLPDLVEQHTHLSARDLVHVATCREQAITTVLSPDRGFDVVADLDRIGLDDVDTLW